MTVGSMFTGIGGLDRGFEAEGFEVIWMVERDPFCRAALATHWPGVPVYDDAKMSIAQWRQVPRPDVIIGGFPCQDVSNAGARAGLSGDRSGLWWCIRRAVRLVRPGFVVVENVPGLFARGFDVVLRSLARVGRDAEWQVVRASDVGAPQLRARVFVVAYPQRDARGDLEQRRGRGQAGDGEESGEAGGWALADADGRRLEKRGQPEPRGQRGPRGGEPDGCGAVRELDDAAPVAISADQRRERGASAGRKAEPRVEHAGNVDDAAVARPQGDLAEDGEGGIHGRPPGSTARDAAWPGWPARPGEPQHAWEPPRVLASARAQRPLGECADGFSDQLARRVLGWCAYANAAEARPSEVMRILQVAADPEAIQRAARGQECLSPAAVLWGDVFSEWGAGRDADPERHPPACPTRLHARARLRVLRANASTDGPPPQGRRPDEQRAGQPADADGAVSRALALADREARAGARRVSRWRRAALQAIGNAVVPQVGRVVARRVLEINRGRR